MFPQPISGEGVENCLVINLAKLPEARVWQIGTSYRIVIEGKMESLNRHVATFSVSGAQPKEEGEENTEVIDTTKQADEATIGNFTAYGGG